MKKALFCFIAVMLCTGFVLAQSKSKRNNATSCLSASQAKDIIQDSRIFQEPATFFIFGGSRFDLQDISKVGRENPILYLFSKHRTLKKV